MVELIFKMSTITTITWIFIYLTLPYSGPGNVVISGKYLGSRKEALIIILN